MQLDSKPPSVPLKDYLYNETRYTMLRQLHPDEARKLLEEGTGGRGRPMENV